MTIQLYKMGVLNGTPNSFSDGGEFNTPSAFQRQLLELADTCDCVDIGVESTAPFNDPISQNLEQQRLEALFNGVDLSSLNCRLSFDTYRSETMQWILDRFSLEHKEVIWNDVSGVFDEQTVELLQRYPKLQYVYSQTRVPQKSLTSNHMDYVDESTDILEQTYRFIESASQNIALAHLNQKVWFDPCFGFSKSREQNYQLMNALPDMINKYSELSWLIGISRKSFLRFPQEQMNKIDQMQRAEFLQVAYFGGLFHRVDLGEIMIRAHDPLLLESLGRSLKMFKIKK